MMTTTLSAFADKAQPPDDATLARVLGPAWAAWVDLLGRLGTRVPDHTTRWRYTGGRVGWGLRVSQDTRIVLSLIPREGSFLASVALGERAVRTLQERGLPADVLEVVDAAPRYAEGRGVRLPVTAVEQVPDVLELVTIKLAP